MKLIVDIPEEDYKFIKDLQSLIIGSRGNCKTIQKNVINAIKNGIPYEERPHGNWFDCIEAGTLKARHGDYVLYKVDFLLDHLAREVYVMEGVRRMKGRRI